MCPASRHLGMQKHQVQVLLWPAEGWWWQNWQTIPVCAFSRNHRTNVRLLDGQADMQAAPTRGSENQNQAHPSVLESANAAIMTVSKGSVLSSSDKRTSWTHAQPRSQCESSSPQASSIGQKTLKRIVGRPSFIHHLCNSRKVMSANHGME